jgi:hypothetical protein
MNGYELSRQWFNFCFKNPHKVKPNHTALYFFAIEHCNRMGWKEIFGFPTTMAKDAVGIKSYTTYKHTLDDLVEWGFIIMHERSKNQYSSNIIALSNFDKAHSKAPVEALDKALIKHASKQHEYINKQINKETTKPINGSTRENSYTYPLSDTDTELTEFFTDNGSTPEEASRFFNHYASQGWCKQNGQPIASWHSAAKLWIDRSLHDPKFANGKATESDYTKYQKQYNW